MTFQLKLRWRTQQFELQLEESEFTIDAMREKVKKLTQVLPERQKLIIMGQTLPASGDFSEKDSKKIKSGNAMVMLMGEPSENIVVDVSPKAEDASDEAGENVEMSDESAQCYPGMSGLANIGNNCYMNSVLQGIYTLLSGTIDLNREFPFEAGVDKAFVSEFMKLLRQMSTSTQSIAPTQFFQALHTRYSFFADTDRTGQFLQHDAMEFFMQLMSSLKNVMSFDNNNFVNLYFMGRFKKSYKAEATGESSAISEDFLQVPVHLVNHQASLVDAIRATLSTSINKRSEVTNEDVEFKMESRFDRLPTFLSITYVRFSFNDRSAKNLKIMRKLAFPFELDMYELCTPELQQKLEPMRKIKRELNNATPKQLEDATEFHPISFDNDVGSNNSGYYTLQAIVTHKGRATTSGHYVAWCKRQGTWYKFDDAEVSPVPESKIQDLAGGAGDKDTAYLLFYSPTLLEKLN